MYVFALLLFYLLQSLSLLLSQNKGSLLLTTVSEKTPSCRSCWLRQLHHCLLKILQCLSFIVLSMRERKLNSEKFKKDKSIDLKVGHPLYKFFWSKSWRGASLCTLTRILEHCELSTVLWRHICKSSYLRCTDLFVCGGVAPISHGYQVKSINSTSSTTFQFSSPFHKLMLLAYM
jgi:hypothetical protein